MVSTAIFSSYAAYTYGDVIKAAPVLIDDVHLSVLVLLEPTLIPIRLPLGWTRKYARRKVVVQHVLSAVTPEQRENT